MANQMNHDTDEILPENLPVVEGGVGPPIDDQVCFPKPPASGSWKVVSIDGVIQGLPNPWVQN